MVTEAIDSFLMEQRRTRRERVTARQERLLRQALREGFSAQQALVLDNFLEGMTLDEFNRLWERIAGQTIGPMSVTAQTLSEQSYSTGVFAQRIDLGVDISFDLAHPRAVAFLENHGSQMISGINETTRRETNRIITNGLRTGNSYDEIADQLRVKFQDYRIPKPQLHIRDRAELIAVQEMGEAYEQGNLDMARELRDLGVGLEKSLLTAEDGRVDEDCSGNAAAGWIPLEQSYPTGNLRPPIHVSCRCTQLVRRIGSEG
jgi:hypothetical protein